VATEGADVILEPRSLARNLLVLLILAWLGVGLVRAADDFLEPERAFHFSARALDANSVEVSFDIAPGYYMYREAFRITAEQATLAPPQLPQGKVKFDETFQKNVETYRDVVRIRIPVTQAPQRFRLDVIGQGCADQGLCYPPMPSAAQVSLGGFGGDGTVRILAVSDSAAAPAAPGLSSPTANSSAVAASAGNEAAGLDAVLRSGRFWSVVGVFLLAGVLLSLTPCVLPMLPILSAIIAGAGGAVSRSRGFALALSYSLGMALVYTALGIGAGLAGEGLAAALQNPWLLGAFAVLLSVLALSMFGAYELRLPTAWTERLTQTSRRLPGGRFAGVFAMGGVSALIVSPCVAAPLAGALVYLSQTRDVALGGTALFSLAAGMSAPLLLLGASSGTWLPRAGAWMQGVKRFFGLLLLGVALWTVQPLLPAPLVLALWGSLLLGAALLLRPLARGEDALAWPRRTAAAVLAVFGLMQLVGAASGGADPLQPLAHLAASGAPARSGIAFTPIRSTRDLDAALQTAGRPVMLDFYADWCVSCKEMERFTFSDATVQARMRGALLLKADVTRNNADDRELLRRFGLFGPPGTLFFDAGGREFAAARVIGFQDRERFLRTLQSVGL
jgi:thiol:disulfide interchange protein DsbD